MDRLVSLPHPRRTPPPPAPICCCFALQQIFRGNVDNNTPSASSFTPPVEAQYVRIYPQVCRRHCTLRMELLGCELTGEPVIRRRAHVHTHSSSSSSCSLLSWSSSCTVIDFDHVFYLSAVNACFF